MFGIILRLLSKVVEKPSMAKIMGTQTIYENVISIK